MRYSLETPIRSLRSVAAYIAAPTRGSLGRESIPGADVYRVRESGRWRLMPTTRTCSLLVRTQRACMLFQEATTQFPRHSDHLNRFYMSYRTCFGEEDPSLRAAFLDMRLFRRVH